MKPITIALLWLLLPSIAQAQEEQKFFPLPRRAEAPGAPPAPKFYMLKRDRSPVTHRTPKITRPEPQGTPENRSAGESNVLVPAQPATPMNRDEQAQQMISLFHPDTK